MSKIYCGIRKVPKGKKRGTMDECIKSKQVRYYGETKIHKKLLKAPKRKSRAKPAKELLINKIERRVKKEKLKRNDLMKEFKNIKNKKLIEDISKIKPIDIKNDKLMKEFKVLKRDKYIDDISKIKINKVDNKVYDIIKDLENDIKKMKKAKADKLEIMALENAKRKAKKQMIKQQRILNNIDKKVKKNIIGKKSNRLMKDFEEIKRAKILHDISNVKPIKNDKEIYAIVEEFQNIKKGKNLLEKANKMLDENDNVKNLLINRALISLDELEQDKLVDQILDLNNTQIMLNEIKNNIEKEISKVIEPQKFAKDDLNMINKVKNIREKLLAWELKPDSKTKKTVLKRLNTQLNNLLAKV